MKKYKRIVVKVGTKVIALKDKALDRERIKDIVNQISEIRDEGRDCLLVTSGAIGAGMGLLGLKKRPSGLSELQAAASIGQNYLMQLYGEYFKARGYLTGQILLTQEDFNDRKRYLNIKHTILTLLRHKAIPVINENDTVSTEEIKCGDNDRLSSLVSDLVGADLLVILTDVDGLMDSSGRVVSVVDEVTPGISKLAGNNRHELGTGGMATKLAAAKSVTAAGIDCIIANGLKSSVILKAVKGEGVGTEFRSAQAKYIAKKRWIAFSSRPKGLISVDNGAAEAVLAKDKSLLASGILAVEGKFSSGDVVSIADEGKREFARGLTNYSSEDIIRIKGLKSDKFKSILGYKGRDEIIHKDNLVIL